MDADRQYAVSSLLFDYMKGPSLRHLRDPPSVHKLAGEIVSTLDRASSLWKKWEPQREEVAKAAAPCWIPIEDLQKFLNSLPGPSLTKTDVEQRLRAIWEEPYSPDRSGRSPARINPKKQSFDIDRKRTRGAGSPLR
jgi:hypothetical protein